MDALHELVEIATMKQLKGRHQRAVDDIKDWHWDWHWHWELMAELLAPNAHASRASLGSSS